MENPTALRYKAILGGSPTGLLLVDDVDSLEDLLQDPAFTSLPAGHRAGLIQALPKLRTQKAGGGLGRKGDLALGAGVYMKADSMVKHSSGDSIIRVGYKAVPGAADQPLGE